MALHFSKEEFKSRKSKVLNSMKEQNLDGIGAMILFLRNAFTSLSEVFSIKVFILINLAMTLDQV